MKILTLTPRKPIIYPPGIISLVLFPLLCTFYLKQHNAFQHLSVINIAFWSPEWNKSLPVKYQFKFPAKRNYLEINLNGNDVDDKTRLDYARLEVRRILTTCDSIKGIDFKFGKHAHYWTFINALDILETENAMGYGPYQDHLYFWYHKPQTGAFVDDVNVGFVKPKPTLQEVQLQLWKNLMQTIGSAATEFWPSALVFALMLFFSFKKLYLNLCRS